MINESYIMYLSPRQHGVITVFLVFCPIGSPSGRPACACVRPQVCLIRSPALPCLFFLSAVMSIAPFSLPAVISLIELLLFAIYTRP